jgi:hypothetical protein
VMTISTPSAAMASPARHRFRTEMVDHDRREI